jgi:hypothetical protein
VLLVPMVQSMDTENTGPPRVGLALVTPRGCVSLVTWSTLVGTPLPGVCQFGYMAYYWLSSGGWGVLPSRPARAVTPGGVRLVYVDTYWLSSTGVLTCK